MVKKPLSEKIYFLRNTRKGLVFLLVLFIFCALAPRFYFKYFHPSSVASIEISKLDSPTASKRNNQYGNKQSFTIPKKSFNPNTYSAKDWQQIGLTENQANAIVNYMKAGTVLYIKSDVKKLYGITPKLYQQLKSKIDLPETLPNNENYSAKNLQKMQPQKEIKEWIVQRSIAQQKPIIPLKINLATKKQLMTVKGIGSFYAEEIIAMRKKYGGIISHYQLLSLYKMDSVRLAEITPFLIIDKINVQKLNINKATQEKLQQHPLISRDMAKSIVYFRNNYKKYTQLDELLLSPYIDKEILKEIRSYLTVGK